jgi:hypothetical protein
MVYVDSTEKYGGTVGNNKLAKPGDIIIEKILVTSYTGFTMNVRGQLKGLVIYEDMFANTLTGQLILNDTMGIIKHFPLVGNEKVSITFYLPGDVQGNKPVELKFRVFNVSGNTKTSTTNARFVVLELTSEEHTKGTTARFSRSLSSMPYSEMVKKILREQVFNPEDNIGVNVSPTIGKKNMIVPYWTPFYAINWIAQKSVSKEDFTRCDYVFYQTINGFYHFVPISEMKALPVTAKYTYVPGGNRTETGDMPIADYLRNISSFSVISMHNKVKSVATGVYSSSLITFDTTTKTYKRHSYDYEEQFKKETAISEYPIVSFPNEQTSLYASSMIKMYPKHSFQFNKHPVNDNVEQYALRRQATMNRLNTQSLRLDVPGDSRLHVGDIVDVAIPSFEDPVNKSEWKDTILSGKYMVTAIKHMIMDDDYSMEMVVSKDSYDYQLPDSKIKSLEVK